MLNETISVISKDREGGKWISEAEVLFLVSLGIGGVVNVLDLLQHWALIFRPNKCILDIFKKLWLLSCLHASKSRDRHSKRFLDTRKALKSHKKVSFHKNNNFGAKIQTKYWFLNFLDTVESRFSYVFGQQLKLQ